MSYVAGKRTNMGLMRNSTVSIIHFLTAPFKTVNKRCQTYIIAVMQLPHTTKSNHTYIIIWVTEPSHTTNKRYQTYIIAVTVLPHVTQLSDIISTVTELQHTTNRIRCTSLPEPHNQLTPLTDIRHTSLAVTVLPDATNSYQTDISSHWIMSYQEDYTTKY